jgi:SulP family sulfate permease
MCAKLQRSGRIVVIAGPLPHPREVFDKAKLEVVNDRVFVAATLDEGLQLASDLILLTPDATGPQRE